MSVYPSVPNLTAINTHLPGLHRTYDISNTVIHEERAMSDTLPHLPPRTRQDCLSCAIFDESKSPPTMEFTVTDRPFNAAQLSMISDWDLDLQNLTEEQNRKLNFRTIRSTSNATTKPNLAIKGQLDKIVAAPLGAVGAGGPGGGSSPLSSEEKDLVYIYRYVRSHALLSAMFLYSHARIACLSCLLLLYICIYV